MIAASVERIFSRDPDEASASAESCSETGTVYLVRQDSDPGLLTVKARDSCPLVVIYDYLVFVLRQVPRVDQAVTLSSWRWRQASGAVNLPRLALKESPSSAKGRRSVSFRTRWEEAEALHGWSLI